MEPALVATTHCLQRATACKSVGKISFVAAPCGVGTICLLAPGPNDTVAHDSFEEGENQQIKCKDGLPNRKLLHWSYGMEDEFRLQRMPLSTGRARILTVDQLPIPHSMWEWEAHGIMDSIRVVRPECDFAVIGLVTDNLGKRYVHNESRATAKQRLSDFLKKVYLEDGFFYVPI